MAGLNEPGHFSTRSCCEIRSAAASCVSRIEHPGDYELKVSWKNHLARSLEFKVGADGKYVSTIASSNQLGSDRFFFPVRIVGDQDGKWNKTAYKSDAYYGNPLTGFSPAPRAVWLRSRVQRR